MNMDFKSAEELLNLCEENQLPISEAVSYTHLDVYKRQVVRLPSTTTSSSWTMAPAS